MTSPPDDSSVLIEGEWSHRKVRANGIALHVAEIGDGPLVLLLHGFPQFWWTWHQQMTALAAAGFRAAAVDLRGYGASDKPPRGYDAPTLAADIAAVVTSLGEADAMIVGNDVGGLLAWTIAATRPQVVRSLVVIGAAHPLRLRAAIRPHLSVRKGSTGRGGADRIAATQARASGYALRYFQLPRLPEASLTKNEDYLDALFARWSGPAWRNTPDYVQSVQRYVQAMRIHPVAHCSLEQFRWLVRSLVRGDGRRYVASMRQPVVAPVLQLHGAEDACVLPSTAAGSQSYVEGTYECRLLNGVGHYPQHEVPELISAELIRWAQAH